MPTVKIYNQQGEVDGTAELPKAIFGVPMNADLLHQAIRTYQANRRKVIAHTKTRGEVRGGGRKPWRQKGTGFARHGSIRSPIWRGGGATFGPRKDRVFKLKLPEKMRRKALFVALSQKLRDQEIFVLKSLDLKDAKTKNLAQLLKRKPWSKAGSFLLVIPEKNENLKRASANLRRVEIAEARNLNALSVASFKNMLIEKNAIKSLEETFLTKS